MNKTAIDKRLSLLEVKRAGPVAICCVQVGTGPALRPDGSKCTVDHGHVIVIGGED